MNIAGRGKLQNSRDGQERCTLVKDLHLIKSKSQSSVGSSRRMTLQYQLLLIISRQENRTLNLKLFHLVQVVENHFEVSDHSNILDQVSSITLHKRFEKDKTHRIAEEGQLWLLLQFNITRIELVDQEKTLSSHQTENFYRGFLLQSGQRCQLREPSSLKTKAKILVESDNIRLYKEHRQLKLP